MPENLPASRKEESFRPAPNTGKVVGSLVYPTWGGPVVAVQPIPAGRPRKSPLREVVETALGAVVLAVLIMTFVARAFTVDGPSMTPSLQDGERLLVDKISYRFVEPQRGDIVVFRYPADPRQHFIKRLIGVPGDVVEIRNGVVILNGWALRESYTLQPAYGRFAPREVPAGHYFVLGDNRNNSEDSRDPRVGFVPRDHIVGRAFWRYWPFDRMSLFQRPTALAGAPPSDRSVGENPIPAKAAP